MFGSLSFLDDQQTIDIENTFPGWMVFTLTCMVLFSTTNSTTNSYHLHAHQVGIGKDHTLYALQPGYIKFYSSSLPFPHPSTSPITSALSSTASPDSPDSSPSDQTAAGFKQSLIKRPREKKQYIGVVNAREERLPRDLSAEGRGRERRFWGVERAGQGAEAQV
jgi:hypothetical protein